MTEIYHFLRLLFVKLGEQYCPDCGTAIAAQSMESINAQIMKRHKGAHIEVFSPLIVDRKGFYTDLAKWALKKGFSHLRVNGELCPTESSKGNLVLHATCLQQLPAELSRTRPTHVFLQLQTRLVRGLCRHWRYPTGPERR